MYCNERKGVESIAIVDGNEPEEREVWIYDVYEVDDARNAAGAKNSVIGEQHPAGDEQKMMRKTLARVLKMLGEYDSADNAEFKAYNEFVESLETEQIIGSVVADNPTDAELLAQAKARKIDEIAEFDASANVNSFTVSGVPMWLNHDQRSRLNDSLNVCQYETMTKYFGGKPYTFPVSQWRQMLNDVEQYADACQTVTEAHKAEMMAMETVAEVEAFDVTIGYPQKLQL